VTIGISTVISSPVIIRRTDLYLKQLLGEWTMSSSLGKKLNELVGLKFRDAGMLIKLLNF
jgi:hypothetical protein